MSNPLKIILGLVGVFVLLLLAAVIVIPMVVDPNDYRDDIARAVEDETGRSFEIEGEISLSVFPWLGLEVGRMRLGNPPGFGDRPFAEIGSAAVGAKLFPLLLSKRLEVSTLRLDGLRLDLVRLADGRSNWEDLGATDDSAAPPDDRDGSKSGVTLERIGGLRLTDARIRYEDRQEGSIVEAEISRFSTGELAPGKPFGIEGEAVVSFDQGKTRVAAKVGGTVLPADDFSSLTVSDLLLDADLDDGRQLFKGRAPEMRVVFPGPSVELDELELGIEASGPDLPGGKLSGKLAAPSVKVDLESQALAIPALSGEFAGMRLNGRLSGAQIVDAMALSGQLAIEEFSPRTLLARLGETPPDAADATALTRASLETQFRAGTERVELESLRLRLDDTTITGSGAIGFAAQTLVRARLEMDAIDLDRYLPPETETAEAAAAEDVPLAFDWLQGLDLDAALKIGMLKLNGLTLTGVDARAVASDGVLTLQPLTAALYGGKLRGSARLDARQSPATLRLEQSLSGLELLPFVRDLADFDRLSGVAQLGANLTTTASSTAGLMSGLNGELSFDVADGALVGVNLWYEIQRAWAVVRGQSVPQRGSADTEFRQLKGTAVIRDGVLRNDDLIGGLPFLGLAGKGQVDLSESALNYQLTATVIRQLVDEATGEPSELAGASIPLRLSGTLDSPSVNVDLGGLVRDRAKDEVLRRLGVEEEQAESAKQDLEERAKDKVRDRLRGILGRD